MADLQSLLDDPSTPDPNTDPALGDAYGDTDTGGDSTYFEMPDTTSLRSSMGTLRGMAQSYMKGVNPDTAFDQIREGKIAALRAARKAFTPPAGQSNLPMLAFGAGMLKPTKSGRLSEALSGAVDDMLPYIQSGREVEAHNREGMAQLDSQEAGMSGEDLYNRMQTGMQLTKQADDLEYKIADLQSKGMWKAIDIRTRLAISQRAKDARLSAAKIMAGQREQSSLAQAVRAAQSAATQDAANMVKMGYGIPQAQYEGWVNNRFHHIMHQWGYTPEQYQRAVTGNVSGNDTGSDGSEISPDDEQDMQQELSMEDLARGDQGAPDQTGAGGASPSSPAVAGGQSPVVAPPDGVSTPPSGTTGDWSRQERPLGTEEAKQVAEGETNIQNLLGAEDAMTQAQALNEDVINGKEPMYNGSLADAHAWVERNLAGIPGLHESKAAVNTTRYNNLINQQVASNLRAVFGGMPTEGERQFLLDLQASIKYSPQDRKPILAQGLKLIRMRRMYNQWKTQQIKGGNYRMANYTDWIMQNDPGMAKYLGKETVDPDYVAPHADGQ